MHPSGGQYGPPGWQQQDQAGPAGPPPQAPPGQYGPPPGQYGGDPWGQQVPQQPLQQPQYGPPPGGQQPGYPGQEAPPQQPVALPAQAGSGMGRLVIEAKASWLFWPLRAFGKPQISINGGPVVSQWGTNVYDLPDGQHNVHVITRYLTNVGEAYVVEPVHAGQQSVLYYKAPVDVFHRGALDGKPGGHPGMGLQIGILIGVVVVIVGLVLLVVLTS